jgi:hypothetical protein
MIRWAHSKPSEMERSVCHSVTGEVDGRNPDGFQIRVQTSVADSFSAGQSRREPGRTDMHGGEDGTLTW